jgi:multicomponent Na+:H+ antiporter subunit E
MGTDQPNRKSTPAGGRGQAEPEGRVIRTVILFVILGIFWLVVSGRIGLQYFIFLTVSVGAVLWMNPERPFRTSEPSGGAGMRGRLRALVAFFRYLIWLVWNVLKANIEVAAMILHPKLPIRPRLFRFRTTLEDDVAKVLVANSITLTPGTVTIDLDGDEYLVHAIHPASSTAVTEGHLQNAVAPIFGEGPQRVPEIQWGSSLQEFAGKDHPGLGS